MRTLARPSSLLLIIVGVLLATFPLLSAARLSRDALAQLPDSGDAAYRDDQHRLAIFSNDFTVATRTYQNSSIADLRDSFQASGFESSGRNKYALPCCGSYDGVWVTVTETTDGTKASVSPIDTDVQSTWLAFPILSVLVVGIGLGLLNRRNPSEPATTEVEDEENVAVV